MEGRDLPAVNSFELRYGDEYRQVLAQTMREAYEFAKRGAADELKVPAAPTKRDTTAFINQNARAVADKQLGDLLFKIKTEVLKELRKNTLSETNLGLSDILGAIGTAFGLFFEKNIVLAGTIAVASGINRGRDDVFESNRKDIAVYQYSALLDDKVCPTCEDLDGKVVDYAEYRATKWVPPIHQWCRCIWVSVLKEQTEIPAVTGLPDNPGGTTEPVL